MLRVQDLPIRARILGGFVAVVAVAGIAVGAGLYGLSGLQKDALDLRETSATALFANRLDADMAKTLVGAHHYMDTSHGAGALPRASFPRIARKNGSRR